MKGSKLDMKIHDLIKKLLAGFIIASLGLVMSLDVKDYRTCTVKKIATVESVEHSTSEYEMSDGSIVFVDNYEPTYTYELNGKTYMSRDTSGVRKLHSKVELGDKIGVLVNSQDPNKSAIYGKEWEIQYNIFGRVVLPAGLLVMFFVSIELLSAFITGPEDRGIETAQTGRKPMKFKLGGYIFIALWFALFFHSDRVPELIRLAQAQSYESTITGVVTDASDRVTRVSKGSGGYSKDGKYFTYKYSVNGEEYIQFSKTSGSIETGNEIKVYVNSTDNRDSVTDYWINTVKEDRESIIKSLVLYFIAMSICILSSYRVNKVGSQEKE